MAAVIETIPARTAGAPGPDPQRPVYASHVRTQDLPWIDWSEGNQIKICKLNPSTGQMVVFIRSEPGASVPVHFHPGTVVVYTVKGTWTYDEGWESPAGDVVYETAGSTHSPRMVSDEEVIVFAVIEGALVFKDAQGEVIGIENWQTLLQKYHAHCAAHGIEPVDVTKF